jgi:hypothetical protein
MTMVFHGVGPLPLWRYSAHSNIAIPMVSTLARRFARASNAQMLFQAGIGTLGTLSEGERRRRL